MFSVVAASCSEVSLGMFSSKKLARLRTSLMLGYKNTLNPSDPEYPWSFSSLLKAVQIPYLCDIDCGRAVTIGVDWFIAAMQDAVKGTRISGLSRSSRELTLRCGARFASVTMTIWSRSSIYSSHQTTLYLLFALLILQTSQSKLGFFITVVKGPLGLQCHESYWRAL
mmetsp:Transcript_1137/g.2748  ORF Transcript_1137/g.2748 Transcript_1137/m.2748 type:complete len:168 (+) Transcript_1137:1428-1931(+)